MKNEGYEANVYCDDCNDCAKLNADTPVPGRSSTTSGFIHLSGPNKQAVYKMGRRVGWFISEKRDVCPACCKLRSERNASKAKT